MRKHCPENERIKRDYLTYLKEAQRYSEPSLDTVTKAISRFETYTRHTSFKKFRTEQAVGFKKKLATETNSKTGKPLSLATQRSTLDALRSFFKWLASKTGYKSKFTYVDADYFNLSEKDNRVAQANLPRPFPSLAQVHHVIRSMPYSTVIEQRDRALMAFVLLTGSRDRALVSLKLKHIDLGNSRVSFDAREVVTKFSKSFVSFFMPVGEDIRAILDAWVVTLMKDHLWGPTDPLFPKPLMQHDENGAFRAVGLQRAHWTTANAVRKIFRSAFNAAGLPYFHPHSIRHTLGQLGETICKSPEEFKAWSQNLGHEHVMTTFNSYGQVSPTRQAELIRQLGITTEPAQIDAEDLLQQLSIAIKTKAKT